MDAVLCDELLQEIFRRLSPSSSASVSLVSHRWHSLLCSSLTALSLRLPSQPPPALLPALLHRYTSLSTLTLLPEAAVADPSPPISSDHLLLSLGTSAHHCTRRRQNHHQLRHLRFLLGPVAPPSLAFVSSSFPFCNLVSLQLAALRPLSFQWLVRLPSIRELSVLDCSPDPSPPAHHLRDGEDAGGESLPLETLSLCGIRAGDHGLGWLWRRCTALRRLHLRGCEGTGDVDATAFPHCLPGLHHLELRTSRTIADRVLLLAAGHCANLTSLLLYDGGSREGLRRFIHRRPPSLLRLDLRLPLDLDNAHLAAMAEHLPSLASLRLQSCCLVTGDGLQALAAAGSVQDLALVNCDVVERETGLLTSLGQRLRRLRRLDLSHNEMMVDREFGAMLASCRGLVEIRVRGCGGLTDAAVMAMSRCCEALEVVDVSHCCGVTGEGVEVLVVNARRLSRIYVEGWKVSEAASGWAARRAIEVC